MLQTKLSQYNIVCPLILFATNNYKYSPINQCSSRVYVTLCSFQTCLHMSCLIDIYPFVPMYYNTVYNI